MNLPVPGSRWTLSTTSNGHSAYSFLRISSRAALTSLVFPRITGPNAAIFWPMGLPSRSQITAGVSPFVIVISTFPSTFARSLCIIGVPMTSAPSPDVM